MELYKVIRPNGIVIVSILRNKNDNTYSFINLTKEHICECRFKNKIEALQDLENQIKIGKIISYQKIGENIYANS